MITKPKYQLCIMDLLWMKGEYNNISYKINYQNVNAEVNCLKYKFI